MKKSESAKGSNSGLDTDTALETDGDTAHHAPKFIGNVNAAFMAMKIDSPDSFFIAPPKQSNSSRYDYIYIYIYIYINAFEYDAFLELKINHIYVDTVVGTRKQSKN